MPKSASDVKQFLLAGVSAYLLDTLFEAIAMFTSIDQVIQVITPPSGYRAVMIQL